MNFELAKHSEKFFYFFEIVNEGSLQAAARKLRLSAPTLTYAIKELETATGVQLLIRSKKGICVSEAGERLYQFCRKFFRDIEDVQTQMSDLSIHAKTKIKIGTFQSIAIYFWPLLLENLKKEAGLSISLTTNRSKVILEALIKREVDIAITVESPRHPSLVRHELYRDEYAFFSSLKEKKHTLTFEDLRSRVLLSIPDAIDSQGKSLRQYVHFYNLVFKEELEFDSFEVIGEFVKKGYGIGILPLRVGQNYKTAMKQVSIAGSVPKRFGAHRFYLSHRHDLEMNQSKLKLVLNSALQAVRQMNQK